LRGRAAEAQRYAASYRHLDENLMKIGSAIIFLLLVVTVNASGQWKKGDERVEDAPDRKESKFDAANDGNVRLLISPFGNGLLSTIGLQEEQVLATSVYDYRAYTEAQKAQPIFELRKELLRLRQVSEEEKEKVLRRLVYFPQKFLMDYKEIVELHLKDKGIAAQLIAEREAWKRRLTSR
jgi:hypothetical protein